MASNCNTKNGRISNTLSTIKIRAKNKNLSCNLTHEYLQSIATDFCPVFNIPLIWERENCGKHRAAYFDSPSLDRIIPEKGYVEGNVVWLSMKANYIKSNATSEELIKVAEWLKTKED